jgi:hypothetical protein
VAVVALMLPNFRSYETAPAGLFWGLFAGFCWAIGTFIVKRTAWPGMGLSLTSGRSSSACRRSWWARWRSTASRPLAVGRGVIATDLHRRHPDGAGHRHLVCPGEAPAGTDRGTFLYRHPDRRHR